VYVERAVVSDFTELLVDRVRSLAVGDPYKEETDVGPLASAQQRQTVEEYLELARAERATFLTGGALGEGCFVDPTILADVDPQSRLVREEIFGPVLVLAEVADAEAGMTAANDTEFGLASAIFTSDLNRALEFVRRTESGLVHVNRETAGVEPHVPFGGLKGSSNLAREQGTAARQFFTTTKTVYIRSPR
jgi:aldehyde dehydrogenase (NAD+)